MKNGIKSPPFVFSHIVRLVSSFTKVTTDLLPPSQTTSTTPPETSEARPSRAGRSSCSCCALCWESWCALWWELWFSRRDRRGTRGSTEEAFYCVTNCFPVMRLSTSNVKFLFLFSKDCTNVYIFEALRWE